MEELDKSERGAGALCHLPTARPVTGLATCSLEEEMKALFDDPLLAKVVEIELTPGEKTHDDDFRENLLFRAPASWQNWLRAAN